MIERRLALSRPLSIRLTLGPLRQGGAYDPCVQYEGERLWWATRTPHGPATVCFSLSSPQELHARAWGEGAEPLLERLPAIVGEHQNDGEFSTDHELVAQLHHEMPGLRIAKTENIWELIFGVILAQRVTGMEATRAFRNITKALNEVAPGPRALLLPPAPERIAAMPYWWFHRFGVERKRAEVLRECARRAKRLDALGADQLPVARKKMLSIPGVGLWTSAAVALVGLGDQDAVPVGDYHFSNHVSNALANEARGDDRRMLELLEPFSGNRGRVLRLLLHGCAGAPKFGPRYAPQPIAVL